MEETKKWYTLYTDKQQSRLMACASSLEGVKQTSEFYSGGTWFEYVDINNCLYEEKMLTGIKFPKEPKQRERIEFNRTKPSFKWVN